jgi:hypothetical protein
VQVRYDDSTVYLGYLDSRIRGSARLYLSDPKYSAPNAKLDSFQIQTLPDGLLTPDPIALLSTIRSLSRRYFGLVTIPADYSLSFEITPKSTSEGWTNVLWLESVSITTKLHQMCFQEPGFLALHTCMLLKT